MDIEVLNGDLVLTSNNDLKTCSSLKQQVYLSLFGTCDWWGDKAYKGYFIKSLRENVLNISGINRIKEAIKKDLSLMGIPFEVVLDVPYPKRLEIRVTIETENITIVWDHLKAEII